MRRAVAVLILTTVTASMPLAAQNAPAWDATFRALTSAAKIGEYMRRLSARPHHVGSPYGRDNAEWMVARFKEWGWEARIETYDVLFPTPKERVLEIEKRSSTGRPAVRWKRRRSQAQNVDDQKMSSDTVRFTTLIIPWIGTRIATRGTQHYLFEKRCADALSAGRRDCPRFSDSVEFRMQWAGLVGRSRSFGRRILVEPVRLSAGNHTVG
jgi:hypothetical protein